MAPFGGLTGGSMRHKLGDQKEARAMPTVEAPVKTQANIEPPLVGNRDLVTGTKFLPNLGVILFCVLMAYPFFVQYLPLGIRQYLSVTLR
jgi:hypothetical protein